MDKKDVYNFLELAGFSPYNPFYIIEQGKISVISEQTNEERLELLKEVAGTKYYESRREESKIKLQDSTNKKKEIQKLLEEMKKKLDV